MSSNWPGSFSLTSFHRSSSQNFALPQSHSLPSNRNKIYMPGQQICRVMRKMLYDRFAKIGMRAKWDLLRIWITSPYRTIAKLWPRALILDFVGHVLFKVHSSPLAHFPLNLQINLMKYGCHSHAIISTLNMKLWTDSHKRAPYLNIFWKIRNVFPYLEWK